MSQQEEIDELRRRLAAMEQFPSALLNRIAAMASSYGAAGTEMGEALATVLDKLSDAVEEAWRASQ